MRHAVDGLDQPFSALVDRGRQGGGADKGLRFGRQLQNAAAALIVKLRERIIKQQHRVLALFRISQLQLRKLQRKRQGALLSLGSEIARRITIDQDIDLSLIHI